MKKVTIQDIADALGISRNTVSKAINNADGLADSTREKILQKAVEMGYKQFSYVAVLSAGNSRDSFGSVGTDGAKGEIALFTTSIFHQTNHFAAPMLDRLRQELSQLNYIMSIHAVTKDDLNQLILPATFVKERCSAILCIEMFDWDYDEMLCSLGLPLLFVDGPNKRSGISLPADQIYMENTMGVTKLVNDMLAKGKKRIGFIGDYEHCQSFYERYTAFRCAMMMAHVPVDEALCIKANFGDEIKDSLGSLKDLPDLFICGNDFVAMDVIQALRELGKTIPDDVMLSGFDDAPESRIVTPQLTTMHIHTQVMAYTAVQLLTSRIQEPSLDFRIVHTETELIYRDSTKC